MSETSGEYSPGYRINFYSGGDTTCEAFGRLIQEVEKIYGILNTLDMGKAAYDGIADAVNEHRISTSPHPNWKPSLSYSDLSGNVDASKVTGKLTGANLDAGNVNGLEGFVKGLIPASEDKGDGITESTLSENGYVAFGNGLMFQWGTSSINVNDVAVDNQWIYSGSLNFPKTFSNRCMNITATPVHAMRSCDFTFSIKPNSLTTSGFGYVFTYDIDVLQIAQVAGNVKISYFAVGV